MRLSKLVEVTNKIYSLRTLIKDEYFWIASLTLKFKLTNRYHNLQPKTLGTSSWINLTRSKHESTTCSFEPAPGQRHDYPVLEGTLCWTGV